MRYAQLVVGPAGSGKSTYCSALVKHGAATGRTINVVNLDPAAEVFDYEPVADVRELISLQDVMEDNDLHFGPNGGLIFCMEYLAKNLDWLQEQLGDTDEDYTLFDCPGQIELYTHMEAIKTLTTFLIQQDFRICGVFLLDCQFISDVGKFFSAVLVALSTQVNLEQPFVNIFTKTDLLDEEGKQLMLRFMEPDFELIQEDGTLSTRWGHKFEKLSLAIGKLIDDYSLIKFSPIDLKDEESITDVLITIDMAIQYGEDADVKVHDFDEPDPEED